jgi:uncharacterized protein YqhQ
LNTQNPNNIENPDQSITRKEMGTELAMGGQAVIEGVMMRSPHHVAVAVRTPDGSIAVNRYPFVSRTKRVLIWKLPILRGIISIIEALVIGFRALNWSAEMTDKQGVEAVETTPTFWERFGSIAMITIALVLGIGLFMGIPYLISNWMQQGSANQFRFHLVAGSARIMIFLLYIWVISLAKDIRRVFQFHGAEHKSIYAFESGDGVDVESARLKSRFHPRCGTSFLFITLIAVLLVYAVIDSIVVAVFGNYPNALWRILVHLPFLPLVMGISFEILKASGKHSSKRLIHALIQPGLWIQRITTREPDGSQLEVALTALTAALDPNDERTIYSIAPESQLPESIVTNALHQDNAKQSAM